MSKRPRPEGDGYAVEVSLLKLKPLALLLAAACFVTLVAVMTWLGGNARQLAASKTVTNHAANHQQREETAMIRNSATSRTTRAEDKTDNATSPTVSSDRDAAPGPSPAGFAENTASNTSPATPPTTSEVTHNAVAAAAPADVPTTATDAPTVVTGGGYAVQAGSYATVSEANERVSALRAAGFEARTAAVEIAGRGTWYRVYSGRFASREEAARHDKKLRASGAVSATIITAVQD